VAAGRPGTAAAVRRFSSASPSPSNSTSGTADGSVILGGILDDSMCSVCSLLVPTNTLAEMKGVQACPKCRARMVPKNPEQALPPGRRAKAFLRRNLLPLGLIVVIAACMPLVLWLQMQDGGNRAAIPVQAIASSLYIFIAIAGNMHRTTPGRFMFGALSLCWVGDLCQALPVNTANQAAIIIYIVAYLVLMISFVLRGMSLRWTLGGMGGFSLMSLFVWLWLHNHVRDDYIILVMFYIAAMTFFCALSLGQYGAGGTLLFVLATVSLYIADTLLASNAFVESNIIFAASAVVLHYVALTLLAFSVHLVPQEE
jgi:YhhN-like protein